MKRCKICRKKPRLERRVNCEGIVFCSDDCYEDYEEHPNDMEHPYIDDYEMIRFAYIDWMTHYEEDLYKYWLYGAPSKRELLEHIDELREDYFDYEGLEGNDGVFSLEIYHYLHAFEKLKEIIRNWEVDGKELKKRRAVLERKRWEALEDE